MIITIHSLYVLMNWIFLGSCLCGHLNEIILFCYHKSVVNDALALHSQKHMLNLPGKCDGCGASFIVDRALDCCSGSLAIYRHNEV